MPPGLQSSVCAKLTENNMTLIHNKMDFSAIIEPCNTIPPPPPQPQSSLSLDINVKSIASYLRKPLLMYTFRCAQEFRRDEYESHYRNVHNDIHGAIDGWMEHRCPLFQYGCNFVHRRWNPKPQGAKIVFNSLVENFGLLMPPCDENGFCDGQRVDFSLLPFEVVFN